VFVGHIHPFRNPAQLIRAMPRVLEAVPGARLILAGRVDLNEPVAAARELGLKEPQVTFLGETAHERVVELIRRAQVYASWSTGPFPSLGTAPMEAMLCGVPVLNDLPENLFGPGGLRQGENILLVDSKDAGSVAQGLVRLLTDPALRERIGAGGRRFVRERLDWGGIARQMIGFYGEIIAKRAAKGGRLRQPGCATPRSL
jgi:phosphatidylinositol alpha-mannosyltransferase